MGDKSKIEWTDATWNPTRGCTEVSSGCTNCYAMRVAHRFIGKGQPYEGLTRMTEHGPVWTGEVRLVPELLNQPLRWKRPRRIFVNSMSDLFHEKVPSEFIAHVFAVMCIASNHQFQILTKRPLEAQYLLNEKDFEKAVEEQINYYAAERGWCVALDDWPLPNVWLGVSCEDQKTADERIPLLLQTPAAVRWISAEPLLDLVDLRIQNPKSKIQNRIDWLVVGGESGPYARPMHPNWVRSLRDQCQAAGVSFFFKQHGEWIHQVDLSLSKIPTDVILTAKIHDWEDQSKSYRVGKKAAGAMLDGREWNEYPEVKS